MGSKTVKFSDLSGQIVEDEAELGRLVVQHPAYKETLTLEVLPQEVEKGLKDADQYVLLTYTRAGETTEERYVLDVDAFDALAKGRPMKDVLDEAIMAIHRQQEARAQQEQPRRRGRPRKDEGAPRAEKTDYTSLEHAGDPHRGRITDAEKEVVRNNLDKINKRLRESGKREIDPNDPDMQQRYGLTPSAA